MFCGWFFSASPLYFELKNLRLSQQTALHFITVVLLYFPLSLGIGWIPFNVPSILIAVVLFLLIYAVIWSGFYLYFKNVAKQLNDDLQHL
ncbi:DUF3021 domain-containing protein [Alteribacillus iranensis]|uniref:DUF3021 domain-containing protein n=1 Tax=Alteribacillus iranensis TaxID=930128 RepID=UPI000B85F938|nr:DUF3021 domain-containing protein [Alteribacillus iranensis]